MYGSFAYYAPVRVLFDAGEGVASSLANHVFAIEDVFISHNHFDHVGSLPHLIGARAHARGTKDKPLNIYYPESNNMALIKDFILKLHPRLPYVLNWIEIAPGFTKTFDNGLVLEAFHVKHAYKSIGFRIMEKRSRLKSGVRPEDARDLVKAGQTINETYWANVFTYTLDSASYDLKNIEGCAHLIADSTFLNVSDRDDLTHASVQEVLDWGVTAKVKRISLAHFSIRYNWKEIEPFVLDAKAKIGFDGQVDIILPNKVYEL